MKKKKTLVIGLILPVIILLTASMPPETDPTAVFDQEYDLLAYGTLADRIALENGMYILEVIDVYAPEAQHFDIFSPFDSEKPREIIDTLDYSLTTVHCRVLGSEEWDFCLYFGRQFVSRSSGDRIICPDDDFPNPSLGDRLLVFNSGMRNGLSSSPPLWETHADQINTVIVIDGKNHITVCLSGSLRGRNNNTLIPID